MFHVERQQAVCENSVIKLRKERIENSTGMSLMKYVKITLA